MRFVLYSSLHELAGSRWLQQHSLDIRSTALNHHNDDDQADANDDNADQPHLVFNRSDLDDEAGEIDRAIQSFQAWTQELHDASAWNQQMAAAAAAAASPQQPTAPALPLVPHKQLLQLAEALQQAPSGAASASTEPNMTAAALISNSVLLCKALKQLACATETLWTAAAVAPVPIQQPAKAAAGPAHNSASPARHQHANSSSTASTSSKTNTSSTGGAATALVSAATAAAPVDAEGLKQLLFWTCHLTVAAHKLYTATAAAATPTPAPAGRHKPAASKPQQWLQHVLPALLQALLACARLLAGNSATGTAAAAAAGAAPGGIAVLCSAKDCAAADRLLLATCLSLVTTSSSSSSSLCPNNTKRPSKSSSSSSASTATLPSPCLHLAAGIYSCHLLFRHRQLQQQQISCSQLSQELCRLLQDHQQQYPQVKELLVTALSGLLHSASTAQLGAQLLCVLAGEVFPEQHQQGVIGQQRKQQQRKQQQQAGIPAAAAAAAQAASRTDAVLLQLELLMLVLSAEPSTSSPSSAAASGSDMATCQTAALLAASMLPVLLPAAVMAHAAVRRLWLGIASTAADATPPVAVAAAAEMAAVMDAHSAGVAALAAAARWDRDANIRSKALGLLADAVPCVWQHLAMQGHMQSPQQQHANNQSSSTTEAAAAEHTRNSSSSSAAVSAALQAQLIGSSKSCRAKALQLLQQLLSDPLEVLAAVIRHAQQQQHNTTDQPPAPAASCKQYVVQWQQELVADTFPCLAALLAAPQDSHLHCPASKAAAEELLPCMAQLLQPQQALHLALDSAAACGRGDDAAAGKLLGSLSQCSEAEVYAVLRQQLTAVGSTAGSAGNMQQQQQQQQQQQGGVLRQRLQGLLAAGSCCSEPLRRHAFVAVCEALYAAADSTTDLATPQPADLQQQQGSQAGQEQQVQQGSLQEAALQLLLSVQLLQLAGGCSNPLEQPRDFRGELAILTDALDWCCLCLQSTAAAGRAARGTAAGVAAAAAAVDVIPAEAGQVPEPGTDVAASAAVVFATFAEAGPISEVEAEASVAVCMEGDEHQEQQQQQQHKQSHCEQPEQQQQRLAATISTLNELLATLLRILHKAAEAAAAVAAAANSKQPGALASAATGSYAEAIGRDGQLLLAGLGYTLLHHLELVVLLTAAGSDSAAALPAQLPVEVLGQYIQVLCIANTGRQFLLHELLLCWHKELASSPAVLTTTTAAAEAHNPGVEADFNFAAAVTAATADAKCHAKLLAFLLLVQHLSAFYNTERQRFKQGLAATLRASAAAAGAGVAAGVDRGAAAADAAGAATAAPKRGAARKRASDGRQCTEQQLHPDDLTLSPLCSQQAAAGAASPVTRTAAADTGEDQSNIGVKFDYMLGEEERQWVEESTAKFTTGLLQETAPACYLPMLLQLLAGVEVPTHVKVLALQALQPLLLVSPALAQQHSTLLAALLADPGTPPGLQLQAATAAGQLIAARPAQSQGLVLQLEQLLLRGLAAAAAASATSAAAALAGIPRAQPHSLPAADVADTSLAATREDLQLGEQQMRVAEGAVEVLCCAAGVYAVLLLGEKLLLAPKSWKVVAAGLLAAEPVQAVSQTMQQLLQCLLAQQHLSRITAALGLLLNCTADTQQPPSTARRPPTAQDPTNSSSRALQLVQDHLLVFLTPKDLATDELQLPLLAALGQAAQGAGWAGAVQPLAALLAACSPSARCLDTLASIIQASKHSLSLHSCPDTLAQLTTYASNYKQTNTNSRAAAGEAAAADGKAVDCENASAAAGGGRTAQGRAAAGGKNKKATGRRGATAAQQQGTAGGGAGGAAAIQVKLLQLLSEVTAAVEGGGIPGTAAGTGTSSKAVKRRAAAQLPPAQQPAVPGSGVDGAGVAGAGLEALQAAELQQLALERRQQLQQYRAAKRA